MNTIHFTLKYLNCLSLLLFLKQGPAMQSCCPLTCCVHYTHLCSQLLGLKAWPTTPGWTAYLEQTTLERWLLLKGLYFSWVLSPEIWSYPSAQYNNTYVLYTNTPALKLCSLSRQLAWILDYSLTSSLSFTISTPLDSNVLLFLVYLFLETGLLYIAPAVMELIM